MSSIKNESRQSPQINRVFKLMLWLNSGCNAKCQTCDIWKEKIGTGLSVEQIRSWAPEWKELGVRTVVICGESLLYSEVWDIVRIIRTHQIKIEMLTNGLLLEKKAEEVADLCDELRVSLDGPEEIHNGSRGRKNAFDALRRGIQRVKSIRPSLRIDGRCAVHRQNFRHLRRTVQAAREIGLNSISFSGADLHNEEAFRRFDRIDDAYVQKFIIQGQDLAALKEELDLLSLEHSNDFDSGFISDSREKLKSLLIDYYTDITTNVPRPIKCNSPWTSAVLEYDGTVRPCFPMPAYGNMREFETLKDLLNSPKALSFREGLNICESETCRRCVDQTFNTPVTINAPLQEAV